MFHTAERWNLIYSKDLLSEAWIHTFRKRKKQHGCYSLISIRCRPTSVRGFHLQIVHFEIITMKCTHAEHLHVFGRGKKKKTLVLFVSCRYDDQDRGFFIRRDVILVESDVKRTHVSFNKQESKLFITRSISRLWSLSAQWKEYSPLDWCSVPP